MIFTMSTTMLLRSGLLPAKLAGQAMPAKPQRCSIVVRAEGEQEGKDDQKAAVQKVNRRRGKRLFSELDSIGKAIVT